MLELGVGVVLADGGEIVGPDPDVVVGGQQGDDGLYREDLIQLHDLLVLRVICMTCYVQLWRTIGGRCRRWPTPWPLK